MVLLWPQLARNGVLILADLYIVGTGPGEISKMTVEAVEALKNCNTIVGYTVYCDLLKEYFPNKNYISSAMKQEKERCTLALNNAKKEDTAMVCSGDAGVYALAGLILELKKDDDVNVKIIPGVTAALSGGALLGAPLGHDFAVISLSDLLTPYDVIEKRLKCAAMGDFAICIYNPSSRKRKDYLKKACEILLEYKKPDTVCGIVKNIGRNEEAKLIMTLKELKDYEADMFTTVFVGNSNTYVKDGYIVTPRGYIL